MLQIIQNNEILVDGGPLYKLLLKKEKAHNMDINSVQWSPGRRLEEYEAILRSWVTLAELGDYARAASLLDELTKEKPNDADVFRLLGEVKFEQKDYQGSVAAYKNSMMVAKDINFEVLRGLTNSLLAAKKLDEPIMDTDEIDNNEIEEKEEASTLYTEIIKDISACAFQRKLNIIQTP
ncbi:hypothetical protein K1719_015999 [Acacia pycnantha]|nr:hypothetical protein K1719_015999 [Acacia pycnantha]